ncbi:MAG: hydrogenase formation protein HypD [Candidatus Kapabacteria bacterium]|nr:hydrogenase formation protein HypD [Candidatus Kapabacteria bacterium]
MKYLDEYRDSSNIKSIYLKICEITTKQWRIMEVCGGQTHSIMKYNLENILPDKISFIHGPGCPVCVTPIEMIDKAIYLAGLEDVILVSYGDMLRVPGTYTDLLTCKANGADIRMLYSPLQAIKIAVENKDKKVIFFAVGFETTAPANALSIISANKQKVNNYFMLCSQVTVPTALELLLSNRNNVIQGLLLPGHVCTVMGYEEYFPIVEKFNIPAVVTGFEPADILNGVYTLIKQLEDDECTIKNEYKRLVRKEGNKQAKAIINEVFDKCDQHWRGIGNIPGSGLRIRDEYLAYNAEIEFGLSKINIIEEISKIYKNKIIDGSSVCIAGEVLQGIAKPNKCPAFGIECTPGHPLGAPMVSSEGACAAYFRYAKED